MRLRWSHCAQSDLPLQHVDPTDATWSVFRFVPGARYVFEVKVDGEPVIRMPFTSRATSAQLTSATRDKLTWIPFALPSYPVRVEALRIDDTGVFETGSSVLLTDTAVGEATWNVGDPTSNYARLTAGPYDVTLQGAQSSSKGFRQVIMQEEWLHRMQ